jgi:hypothetical protein
MRSVPGARCSMKTSFQLSYRVVAGARANDVADFLRGRLARRVTKMLRQKRLGSSCNTCACTGVPANA